jgi:hypothetical protein
MKSEYSNHRQRRLLTPAREGGQRRDQEHDRAAENQHQAQEISIHVGFLSQRSVAFAARHILIQ